MQPSQALVEAAVRAAPRLGVVAAVSIVVTLLWAIFGWSWFDVGLWPWALAAVPIAVMAAIRLQQGAQHRERADQAWSDATSAARTLVLAARRSGQADGKADLVQAAMWTAQARLSPGGVYSRLRELLSDDDLAMVRDADDPLEALLEAVGQACNDSAVDMAIDQLRGAVARSQALARSRSMLAEPVEIASLALMATLPIGLVTTTGWWTMVAALAVSLSFFLMDDLAAQMEDAFGLGGVRADVPRLAVSESNPPQNAADKETA